MTTDVEEPYEVQRARAWAQLQYLNSLPSFTEKLDFWLKTFGCVTSSTRFGDGENAPFTLKLKAENAQDRELYYTTFFEAERSRLIGEKGVVERSGWTNMAQGEEQVAFRVRPIDSLIDSMNERLSKHPSFLLKKASLKRQLEDVTSMIDACMGDDKRRTIYYTTARDLRHALEVGDNYEKLPAHEPESLLQLSPLNKITIVAKLWDIIHFERYLIESTSLDPSNKDDKEEERKDRLFEKGNSSLENEGTNSPLCKPKRINGEAQNKRERIYKKYDEYLSRGHTHESAVASLVHDFKYEYNPDNPKNRRKQIMRIIRGRNNREQ